jgi:hypothetical protein
MTSAPHEDPHQQRAQSQPAKWWHRFRLLVWIVDAVQILGLGGLAFAGVSAVGTFALGIAEQIPLTPLVPFAAATFFVVLMGSFSVAERLRNWNAAKQSNPSMTVEEFLAVTNAQRDMYESNAAWTMRNALGTAIRAHMEVWKNTPDLEIEKCRKSTASFITVAFDKPTRREFLREVAGAAPEHKRHVALSYLHGLLLRTMAKDLEP